MSDTVPVTTPLSRLRPPFVAPVVTLALIDEFLVESPADDSNASAMGADDFWSDLAPHDLVSIDRYLEAENDVDADGWAVSSWQSYDWQGLAILGSSALSADRTEADAVWAATDWSVAIPEDRVDESQQFYGSPHPTAAEVAEAFDAIAQKIRSGELSIDQVRGTPSEAALAAALAAMLKLRR